MLNKYSLQNTENRVIHVKLEHQSVVIIRDFLELYKSWQNCQQRLTRRRAK